MPWQQIVMALVSALALVGVALSYWAARNPVDKLTDGSRWRQLTVLAGLWGVAAIVPGKLPQRVGGVFATWESAAWANPPGGRAWPLTRAAVLTAIALVVALVLTYFVVTADRADSLEGLRLVRLFELQSDFWWAMTVVVLVVHFIGGPSMFLATGLINRLFAELVESADGQAQGRFPRLMPAMTGVVERWLFTPVALVLLKPGILDISLLAAVFGGYIAIRTFRVERGDADNEGRASVHAIWNMSINLAFPILAGWLFWRVPLNQ